jgi:hypothetical protein
MNGVDFSDPTQLGKRHMNQGKNEPVVIRIAGEEHVIRSSAEPEYTKR